MRQNRKQERPPARAAFAVFEKELQLFRHAPENTVPHISKTVRKNGEDTRIPDREAIQLSGSIIEQMREGVRQMAGQAMELIDC